VALPKSNPSPKTDAVAGEIKRMGPKDLSALPDLDGDDFRLIGTLIQYFGFMDFNLRRALVTFHDAKMLPKEYLKFYPKIQDSLMTKALAEIVTGMDPKQEHIETALTWIKVIDVTRTQRNLVAHFAGKRHPKEDVYVFVSKNEKDAIKVLGTGLGANEVYTSVLGRSEFVEMVGSAKNALDWLAKKVPEWHDRYGKKP